MVGLTGITDHQLAGYSLTAQHSGHQRGVVKADAGLFLQHLVQHRQVAALYGGCKLAVIADIGDHVIVNRLHLADSFLLIRDKLLRLCRSKRRGIVIHVLVGMEEGCELVFQLYGGGQGQNRGILIALHVLKYTYLIFTVSVGEWEHRPLTRSNIIGILGGGALELHFKALIGFCGIAHHYIAAFRVGIIDLGAVVLLDENSRRFGSDGRGQGRRRLSEGNGLIVNAADLRHLPGFIGRQSNIRRGAARHQCADSGGNE